MGRILIITLLVCHTAAAAPIGETRAFNAAVEIFRDKKYDVAERSFAEFLGKHSNSDFRTQAVLYLAKAQVNQKKYDPAIELLQSELPQSEAFADQYRFWIAEAHFQKGNFEVAAQKYADMVKSHLDSPLVLEASYNKALSFSRLGKWETVVELLSPGRSFSKFAESKPNDRFTIQGTLLLAEGLFALNRFADAELQLKKLEKRTEDPDLQWRQQFLLARTQFALDNLDTAAVTSSNAVALARTLGRQRQIADSIQVQAEILEKAGKLADAVQAYEQNLSAGLPPERRRQALFKSIQLTVAQGKNADAITRLEQFATLNTNDTSLDLALFTLGELRLKQVFAWREQPQTNGLAMLSSNWLQGAFTNFNQVISNYPGSDLLGKTYLNRGWCRWLEEKYHEAQSDFAKAVTRLPLSEEQGIARFKLADTLFITGDFAGAVSNYNALVEGYADLPAVKETLFDQALYQVVRAGLHSGDAASAFEAMNKILQWYPNTGYAERSVLLVGQGLNRKGSPSDARALFSGFLQRWPDAALAPEVRLALAQTYVREGKWLDALASFEEWTATYTNSVLRPQAEFGRALVTYQAGMETNALNLFVEFTSKYATNSLAALAQNWIGDYYFNRDEFALAEENYQLVTMLNPSVQIAAQSRIGAARAAFERDDLKNARTHFLSVINDTNTPPAFLAEAYFGLGDTIFSQFMGSTQKSVDDFREAVQAFTKVTRDFSTNSLVPLAWGRLGECHLQWANLYKEASAYDLATNAFRQVLDSPHADLQARSLARLGMGKVFEAAGQPLVAWEHYAKLLYIGDDEDFDAKCVKEAGLAAAKLCENDGQWEQAMNVYRRLLLLVPSLKPAVEKKMASVRVNLDSVRN
ncbi:MAG: tetratricopeptide repeat protein [Limisphaerales bacterium]